MLTISLGGFDGDGLKDLLNCLYAFEGHKGIAYLASLSWSIFSALSASLDAKGSPIGGTPIRQDGRDVAWSRAPHQLQQHSPIFLK